MAGSSRKLDMPKGKLTTSFKELKRWMPDNVDKTDLGSGYIASWLFAEVLISRDLSNNIESIERFERMFRQWADGSVLTNGTTSTGGTAHSWELFQNHVIIWFEFDEVEVVITTLEQMYEILDKFKSHMLMRQKENITQNSKNVYFDIEYVAYGSAAETIYDELKSNCGVLYP